MNEDLAHCVYQISHVTGEFRLRSGLVSNEYFDKYRFEAQPALLRDIAREMTALVPADSQLLAGLELGGVPVATALSLETGLPAVFVRKKAKEYGTCKLAEGPDIAGKRITIVEDVVTSGGQILESAEELRTRGAQLDRVLCVIDREAGGAERLTAAGLTLRPLFRMSELEAAARK